MMVLGKLQCVDAEAVYSLVVWMGLGVGLGVEGSKRREARAVEGSSLPEQSL